MRIVIASLFLVASASVALAADAEQFCAKPTASTWDDNTTIACYSDAGCAYAESLGAYAAQNYDVKSVVAALAREKIEGIVTSSAAIITAIEHDGYVCKPAKL